MSPLRLSLAPIVGLAVLVAACSDAPIDIASNSGAAGSGGAGGGLAVVPCDGTGISKGPWSFAADSTSVKIRWEACRAGTTPDFTLTPEAGGPSIKETSVESTFYVTQTYKAELLPSLPADWAGTYYMHEAALTGLAPATCYSYSLLADETKKARFCTARNPGDELKFMAIGDTNPGLTPAPVEILSYVLPMNPDFVIHGGDIEYYSSGLETWAVWFQKMQPMLNHGAFYPAIGNHESEEPEEFDQWTERYFSTPGFDGTVYYRFSSAGIWFFALDTEQPLDPGSPQATWLTQSLEDASSQPGYRFSIVYFHRPFVTCGDTDDNSVARMQFEPLFQKTKVPLVIQAHMHGYERFEINGITYVTAAGGGGAIGDVNANITRPECAMRLASGGFHNGVLFDVTKGMFSLKAIDEFGTVRDSFSKVVP